MINNNNRQLNQFINKKESMVTKKNRIWAMLALVVAITGLASCLKNDTTPPKPYTTLVFFSAAPVSYSTDIWVNGAKAASNLTYATGGGINADPGSLKIDFKRNSGDSLLATTTASYDTMGYYTHFLYGTSPLDVYTIDESQTFADISTTKSNVRFFHMSTDVGPVDFYINTNKVSSSRYYNDFQGGMYDEFMAVDPNTATITAKAAGTDSTIAVKNDVQLAQGYPHTIVLTGISANTGDFKPKITVLNH